jgi:N-methylhydantoinase A
MAYRLGADIGGTFTDLILVDDSGEIFQVGKVLTTPDRPDDAVLDGLGQVLEAARVAPDRLSHLVHGTTLFTNALIERKGARTALVTTRGFRDAIEIGREHRYDIYDLYLRRPSPLAPRSLRFELSERVLVDGAIRTPLDERELEELIERLRAERIEAVAVCLLHSYVNDTRRGAAPCAAGRGGDVLVGARARAARVRARIHDARERVRAAPRRDVSRPAPATSLGRGRAW